MTGYSGAWKNSLTVAEPAPLGKANPDIHMVESSPVTRDDAPESDTAPQWVTREEQLAAGIGMMTDPLNRLSHDAGGLHGSHLDETIGAKGAPPWVNYEHKLFGGDHTGQPVKGSAGAAHGGLRADNSAPWANPDGFDLGKEYTPVQPNRPVWNGRMRGLLRAFSPLISADGTQSQPTPDGGNSIRTSPFDTIARVTQGHGVSHPTQRHTPRPNEGDVNDNLAFPLPQTTDFASQWVG